MESGQRARAERAALVALVVTGILAIAKILVWISTSSLVVLSQALDSFLDVVALALVFVGVRLAGKPADHSHHYGHAKAEHLAAFTQTIILIAVAGGVAFEGIVRLSGNRGGVDTPWYAFALLGTSAVVDSVRARSLTVAAREARSDALKAGALNIAADVGTALVALVSLVLVRNGPKDADAIGALVVAAVVAYGAVRLGRRSVDVLMDRADEARADAIAFAAASAPGVAEARRVRVRTSGDQLFADVTVAAGRTASLERAHDIAEDVEREIERVAPGTDVVVHVEPVSETSGLVERVQAAASRVAGIHEVHNVLVHAFNERGESKLHVTFHAKVRSGLSLKDAHGLADRVEAAVAKELGNEVRVDAHIEPMETTAMGHDVTATREDIVSGVRKIALEEPDVVDCHEVLVTAVGGDLSVMAHVRGRGDLPLARIHDASERIEKGVHAQHPDVATVVIHFEPA